MFGPVLAGSPTVPTMQERITHCAARMRCLKVSEFKHVCTCVFLAQCECEYKQQIDFEEHQFRDKLSSFSIV